MAADWQPNQDRAKGTLQGIRVLVTRPPEQAQSLCKRIAARGGHPLHIPVLEILPPRDPAPALTLIRRLPEFDMAIFISANAVRRACEMMAIEMMTAEKPGGPIDASSWPEGVSIAAIGRSTAQALADCGLTVHIQPQGAYNSEALLALEPLWEVRGKRILIFRGEGGRALLADTLRQRGAEVAYAEVYRRAMPQAAARRLRHVLRKNCIDIVTVTSNEGLQNLHAMAGSSCRRRLLHLPLVVISQRTALLAAKLGFSHAPMIAHESSDEGLVAAIEAWYAMNHNESARRVIHE